MRCCSACRAPCSLGEFRKVAGLQNSGLLIYVHKDRDCTSAKRDKTFILHNASDKELRRPDYIKEMCQYRTRCFQCKAIMKKVRSLLDDINDIERDQIIAICEYCKKPNLYGKCKRCEYISKKYLKTTDEWREKQQQRFNLLLSKINELLRSILECDNFGKHGLKGDTKSLDELETFLRELKSPRYPTRQPHISAFPRTESGQLVSLEYIAKSKEILMDLFLKIQAESGKTPSSFDSTHLSPVVSFNDGESCICRSLRERKKILLSEREITSDSKKVSGESDKIHYLKFEDSCTKRKISTSWSKPDSDKKPRSVMVSCKTFKSENIAKEESHGKERKTRVPDFEDLSRSDQTSGKIFDGGKKLPKSGSDDLSKSDKTASKMPRVKKATKEMPEKNSKLSKSDLEKQLKYDKITRQAMKDEKARRAEKGEKDLMLSKSDTEKSKSDKTVMNISPDEKGKKPEKTPTKDDKSPKGLKPPMIELSIKDIKMPTRRITPDDDLLLRMIQQQKTTRGDESKTLKRLKDVKIEPLPVINRRVVEDTPPLSIESEIVVCDTASDVERTCNEMIKGNTVVQYDPHYKDKAPPAVMPALFEIDLAFSDAAIVSGTAVKPPSAPKSSKKEKREEIPEVPPAGPGVFSYKLSNKKFIEKGWTILPTTKIMRRMNVYKMQPANPQFDWFVRHKDSNIMFYDTGEKLAEIVSEYSGKWYYKNGIVALEYYRAEEVNVGQRYVVYSTGEDVFNGRRAPISILATFDFLGNGVVYDNYGNERLKYNQTEGVVLDRKIGPLGRWQWHSLNEPPILQPVFIDTHVKDPGPCLSEIIKNNKDSTTTKRESHSEMLAIEFDNFVKEKADKLLQKFKPFAIRMKAFKINDHFSLRVLNQSNICLMFRDGPTCMKLNLGMLLKSDEIVDTEASDVDNVATPYDRVPPRSQSVADIQRTIQKARRIGKIHESRKPVYAR